MRASKSQTKISPSSKGPLLYFAAMLLVLAARRSGARRAYYCVSQPPWKTRLSTSGSDALTISRTRKSLSAPPRSSPKTNAPACAVFKVDASRREYLAAHLLARTALSHCASQAPESWRFRANPYGKPFVDPPRDLFFSLSRRRGLVACLVARGYEVGVDVESIERSAEIIDIANRVFSARGTCATGTDELRRPARSRGLALDPQRGLLQSERHGLLTSSAEVFLRGLPADRYAARSRLLARRRRCALEVLSDRSRWAPRRSYG